jgi:hypothetical protein
MASRRFGQGRFLCTARSANMAFQVLFEAVLFIQK